MTEDRAERISKRRSKRKRRDDHDEKEDESQTTQTPVESQTKSESITNRNHSTFYLRDDLMKELRQTRKQLELDVEIEYGIELEKNRHIRPLLLYLGAQQVQDMDATDIIDVLNTTDVLDNVDISDVTDGDSR